MSFVNFATVVWVRLQSGDGMSEAKLLGGSGPAAAYDPAEAVRTHVTNRRQ
jgi:hypothetical protein